MSLFSGAALQDSGEGTLQNPAEKDSSTTVLLELIRDVETETSRIAATEASAQGGAKMRSGDRKRAAMVRKPRAHTTPIDALRSLNSALSLYGHRLPEGMQVRLLEVLEPWCEIPPSCLSCQQSHLSIYATPVTQGSGHAERDREREAEVRMAINCLGSLVSQAHKRLQSLLQPAYKRLFEDLSSLSAYIRSNTAINRILSSTLRSLACVVKTGAVAISDEEFRKLLRIAKMCCFYATPTLPILALGLQGSSASDSSDSSGSDLGSDGDRWGSDGRRRVGGASPSPPTAGGNSARKDSSWRIRMHGAELLGACGAAAATKKRLWSMQLCSFLFPMSPIFSSPSATSSALVHHMASVQQQQQAQQQLKQLQVENGLPKESDQRLISPSVQGANPPSSSPAPPPQSGGRRRVAGKGNFRVDVSRYTPSDLLIGITSVSLCQLLMEEAVDKVRVSLANALASMVEGAHLYLSTADDEDPCDAKYLTIGQQIGGTLFQLHMTLLAVLQCSVTGKALRCAAIPSDVLTTAVLHCLARLVRNSPYDRLMVGYLSEVTRFVEPFLHHPDATVQAAALGCLAAVVGTTTQPLPEVELCLAKAALPRLERSCDLEVENPSCGQRLYEEDARAPGVSLELLERCTTWSQCCGCSPLLIQKVLSFLDKGKGPTRTAAYQVMVLLAKHYYDCFRGCWERVLDAVTLTLDKSKSENVRASAMGLLYAAAKSAADLQQSNGGMGELNREREHWEVEMLAWKRIMREIVPLASTHESHSLQGSCFLLLSSLTPAVLETFEAEQPKIVENVVEMVLSAISSSCSTSVRVQALEALRPLLQHQPLASGPAFLSRAWAPLHKLLRGKTSQNVRVRACSVLATLCESLVTAKRRQCGDGNGRRARERAKEWSFHLLNVRSLSAIGLTLRRLASDKGDKAKISALRGIGHFGYFLPAHFLTALESPADYTAALVAPVIAALQSKNAKVLWNACYAMAKLFENPLLYTSPATAQLLREGMCALAGLMHDSENFKIRINAALSLAVPTREEFGNTFVATVWPSLLAAWKNASRATDFSGYRYSHTLRNQVASTLLHVMREADEERDTEALAAILTEEAEPIFEFISFNERAVTPVAPSPSGAGDGRSSPPLHRRRRSSHCVEMDALSLELALFSVHRLYSALVASCPAKQQQLGRLWSSPE